MHSKIFNPAASHSQLLFFLSQGDGPFLAFVGGVGCYCCFSDFSPSFFLYYDSLIFFFFSFFFHFLAPCFNLKVVVPQIFIQMKCELVVFSKMILSIVFIIIIVVALLFGYLAAYQYMCRLMSVFLLSKFLAYLSACWFVCFIYHYHPFF